MSFSGEEKEIEQTKMLSAIEKTSIKNDLEDEDLGATRAIPLKRKDKEEEKLVEESELEIEDL